MILQEKWPSEEVKKTKIRHAIMDTLIWQGLASVIIPGFTINRICWAGHRVLHRTKPHIPWAIRRRYVTVLGLCAIPFIVMPIDRTVDWGMEATVRKWYHIDAREEQIVHHTRND